MKLSNGNKTSDCVYILCLKVNSIFLKINSKSRKRIPMPIIGRVWGTWSTVAIPLTYSALLYLTLLHQPPSSSGSAYLQRPDTPARHVIDWLGYNGGVDRAAVFLTYWLVWHCITVRECGLCGGQHGRRIKTVSFHNCRLSLFVAALFHFVSCSIYFLSLHSFFVNSCCSWTSGLT